MKKGIEKTVEIPEGIDLAIEGLRVSVEGPNGELSRNFDSRGIEISKEDDKVIVKSESNRKRYKALVGTIASHIRNMIQGVTEDFTSELKIVYSHFPLSVHVEGDSVKIENFIGGEKPRYAKIVGDAEVQINGDEIEVKGPNKEDVGQTAANIEQIAQVKNKDPRVFQDGIYITKRP